MQAASRAVCAVCLPVCAVSGGGTWHSQYSSYTDCQNELVYVLCLSLPKKEYSPRSLQTFSCLTLHLHVKMVNYVSIILYIHFEGLLF